MSRSISLVAALMIVGAGPVAAEDRFTNDVTGWVEPFAVRPASADSTQTSGMDAPAAWAAPDAASTKQLLRHLPLDTTALIFRGEADGRSIPVFLTADEAARITEFNLAVQSAVSALPEASRMDIRVNGSLIGSAAPSPDDPEVASFPLPPGLLVEGFNEVKLIAVHHHRVDCSIAGTYELWSRVIAEKSGFVGRPGGEGFLSLKALPALLQRAVAPSEIRVWLPSDADPSMVRQMTRLINAVVLLGWITDPQIKIATDAEPGPGLNLLLAREAPSEITSQGARAFADTPGLYWLETDEGAGRYLVMSAETSGAAEAQIRELEKAASERAPSGSENGLRALISEFGAHLPQDGQLSLADLGIEPQEFSGRRFSQAFQFLMPADFYQADYGNASFFINARYGAGLLPQSTLRILVNGNQAATLPLDGVGGDEVQDTEVKIPLRAFRPGMNTISLEADTLTERDLVCDPETTIASSTRFFLSNQTRLVVPAIARVGRLPNLSATLAHGFPYAETGEPLRVYVVGDRASGAQAAMAFLARLTASSQKLLEPEIRFSAPDESGSGVVIGPLDALPIWARDYVGSAAADPIVTGSVPAPSRERRLVVTAAGDSISQQPTLNHEYPSSDRDIDLVRERFSPAAFAEGGGADGVIGLHRMLSRAEDWLLQDSDVKLKQLTDPVQELYRNAFTRETSPVSREIGPNEIVFAQSAELPQDADLLGTALVPGRRPSAWTIISALDAQVLGAALSSASAADIWEAAAGGYVKSGPNGVSTNQDAEGATILFATQPPGIKNTRLVLAGWLSSNLAVYASLVCGSALLLGMATFAAARTSRRRNRQ